MNHLVSYNESNTNEEYISRYINWNLIDMAKELSLEFLDDGYIVNLEIRYPMMNTYDPNNSEYILYEIDWEHGEVDSRPWKLASVNQVLNMGPIDKDDFIYIFMIYKMEFDPYNVEDLDKSTMCEFISILKEAFPNNIIRIERSYF